MVKATRNRALEILLLVVVLVLLFSILLPSWRRWNAKSGRLPCPNHLRIVGQALLLYAMDHGGVWPSTLDELVAASDITPEVIACDVTKKPFVFVRAGIRASDLGGEDLAAYELLEYHDGQGTNALFGDGHVAWLSPEELKAALARPVTGPATMRFKDAR